MPSRKLLLLLTSLFLVTAFSCAPREQQSATPAAPPTLVVLTYGGEFAKAQRVAYFDPFEKATGIHVKDVAYNSEYGLIKAAVQGGHPQWDLIDIDSSTLVRGKRENLFEPIDYTVVSRADLVPQGTDSHAVATDFYSVAVCWNTKTYPQAPHTWADVWDLKRFPGPRTLQGSPKLTLEAALLADGVAPAELYKTGL